MCRFVSRENPRRDLYLIENFLFHSPKEEAIGNNAVFLSFTTVNRLNTNTSSKTPHLPSVDGIIHFDRKTRI